MGQEYVTHGNSFVTHWKDGDAANGWYMGFRTQNERDLVRAHFMPWITVIPFEPAPPMAA